MGDFEAFTEQIIKFRDERDWKQFHRAKDMMLSLMLEAAELAEHAQWKSEQEFSAALPGLREKIGEELSDVLYWTLLIAHDLGVDLRGAFAAKMRKNEAKYPVELAKGTHRKYDQF